MVVQGLSPRASVKPQSMSDTSISPRKDKYDVLSSIEGNEPVLGNIEYSALGRDTIIDIERVGMDKEAESALGDKLNSPFSRDIMTRLDVDTDSTTHTMEDERRDDVESHGNYRNGTIDDGSTYLHGGELYSESSEDTMYYETKTHVSQTPRSLICEGFSFHPEDLDINLNLQANSTMDESVNNDRVNFDIPSHVKYLGSNDLNDLKGGDKARRGNLRTDTFAPTSPSPRTETVWSPTSLCGPVIEEELNDVIKTFVNTLSSDDSMQPSGDEDDNKPLFVSTSTPKTNLSTRMLTPKSPTGNQEVAFQSLVHTLSEDTVESSGDEDHHRPLFVSTSTPKTNLSTRLLTPKSPTGNQEVTFQSLVQTLWDDSIESRGDGAQTRPLSVRTSTPPKKLYVRMLTPKSPTGNQEVTFENNQSPRTKKNLCVRMLTPKSPTGNQEVSFENNSPLETSVGLIEDVTESNGGPGCVSDLVEASLSCSSPRANTSQAHGGLVEARHLYPIVETLESNKSKSSKNMIETKGHPVMMSASPTVAGDAQENRERRPSLDQYSATGYEGEVVWDANELREAMKNNVPMATCETIQQDIIYSSRKATKRTDALVEIPLEEAFWVPEKYMPMNRRLEYSRQRAAVLHEIRQEEANLRRKQARTYSIDTVGDVLNDLCFIDDKNVATRDVFDLAVNLCVLVFTLGRSGRMEGEMPAQSGEPQHGVSNELNVDESELRAFRRLLKKRLSSRARSQSKPVPRQPVLVQAIRDLCFMGPSERLVRFEKTLLLETKAEGMKANASGRINKLKEEDPPVLESAQHDDPKETAETTEVDHEYEQQIADYLARHSVNESTTEPTFESDIDQHDNIEEFVNAALNKREVSNAAKKKLKPYKRVLNESLRSSHSFYSKHKFGRNAEIVKAVRDLVFLDSERSIGYEGNTLLTETHAKGTKLLAAESEPKERNSLGETIEPGVEIEVNNQGMALQDLFFLDLCEGYASWPETYEESKLPAFKTEPLDEQSDADIDEGRDDVEDRQPARDRALLDSESTEYEEISLTAKPHADGSEQLAPENHPLDETRDPTATIGESCEQGQRELDLVSENSESTGFEGNALAAELHAKRTLIIESRKGHSSQSNDGDEAYDVNEHELALLDLLVESHERATKLLAAEIKSRKRQSLDEKGDRDVDEGYEVDEGGTVFSDDGESATTCSSDNAVIMEELPIVPTSDENRMITLDEDVEIMFQAGLFAFNDIIVDEKLRYKIDRILTAMFDKDKELIPASKELLPLYHVLKAMIAEHHDQGGSEPSPGMMDECHLGGPLEVMEDLREFILECFSPK